MTAVSRLSMTLVGIWSCGCATPSESSCIETVNVPREAAAVLDSAVVGVAEVQSHTIIRVSIPPRAPGHREVSFASCCSKGGAADVEVRESRYEGVEAQPSRRASAG